MRIGVTDFAQQSLGDVVDVTLPEPGDTVDAGEACGDIESVKSVSDLVTPITGTVRARNDDLTDAPDLVNTDPYGQGWMFEIDTDPATLDQQLVGPDGRRRLPRTDRCLMDYQLQVITLSVSDVDKAAAFYTQQAGFTARRRLPPRPAGFRVVQLTPPGSACSIQIGAGLTDAPPGSARATYLAVTDIEAAHQELTARGVTVSGIQHKSPIDDWKGALPARSRLRSTATTPASPTSPTPTATPG